MTSPQRARQADLARLFNVSRQAIHDLVARRVIEKGADGLIDVELARVAIANRVRPGSKTAGAVTQPPHVEHRAAVPAEGSLNAARVSRETTEAQIAQLKLLEMTGKALSADAVASATFEKARIARDAVMAVVPRVYQQLAAETDPVKVRAILTAELRRACGEISAGELEQTRQ